MKNGGGFHGMLLLSAKCSRSLVSRKTPFERRFGEPFKGPVIPPISRKDQSRLHQFVRKYYMVCSSDKFCTREEFGRVTY